MTAPFIKVPIALKHEIMKVGSLDPVIVLARLKARGLGPFTKAQIATIKAHLHKLQTIKDNSCY